MGRILAAGSSEQIFADSAASFTQQSAYFVALWINGPQQAGVQVEREFFSEGSSSTLNPFLLLRNDTTANGTRAVVVCRNDAGGTSQINSARTNNPVLSSAWHHFVYTQSVAGATTTYRVYVDGVADITASFTNGTTTLNRLGIGCARRTTSVNFFSGTVAHVCKGARLLSASEAVSLASGLSPLLLTTPPDHYWPIFGVDSPEPDLGTSAHVTGSLSGTAFAPGRDPAALLHL